MHAIDAPAWTLPAAATLAGIAGVAAIWVALGSLTHSAASWMGLVGAADVALLLRLTQAPGRGARMAVAALATVLAIVASQWLLASLRVGELMGLGVFASALRLGPALGWQVVSLGLDRVDWVLLLAAPPLAALLAEGRADPPAPGKRD